MAPPEEGPIDVLSLLEDEVAEGGLYVPITICGIEIMAFVDSGSTVTTIHPDLFEKITRADTVPFKQCDRNVIVGNNDKVRATGATELDICFRGGDSYKHKTLIADLALPFIIGKDFMKKNPSTINLGKNTLTVCGIEHFCYEESHLPREYKIRVARTVVVPPRSEMIIEGQLEDAPPFVTGLLEASRTSNPDLLVARILLEPANGIVPVRIANTSKQPLTLYEYRKLGTCQPCTLFSGSEEEEKEITEARVPEHVADILNGCKDNLNPKQVKIVEELLNRNKDAFQKSPDDNGRCDIALHPIDTGNAKPIKQQPRRLPRVKKLVVKEHLSKMSGQKVIKPSKSNWASNIVLVRKEDGTYRFCVDYRQVNGCTIKDCYPLPRIEDSLETLAGCSWFTCLDLASGYWQLGMDPKDAHKTAFTTPYGLWEFTVLPYGLCNAPATFERVMEQVLKNLHWETCLIYLDDILIFAQSFEEHVERVEEVLRRFRNAGLKLQPKKCHFFQKQVEYLGHVISHEGIATSPKKTEAVTAWPTPRTLKQVRSFLGFCSYYRRYVKNFATIAKPLYHLTEKKVKFVWSTECENAFIKLKEVLTTPPILAFPQEEGDIILDTDASGVGLGAVISQVQDGHERVLLYHSQVLSHAERQYCVTRRELLAIVEAVEKFHHYIYGRNVLVRTDHGSLTWLLNFKHPEGQMARWFQTLGEYDLTIKYREGKSHGNADGMSRRPCGQCKYCERQEERERIMAESQDTTCMALRSVKVVQMENDSDVDDDDDDMWIRRTSVEEIKKWQEEDRNMAKVMKWIQEDTRPAWLDIAAEDAELKVMWSVWKQLESKNGVLYRQRTFRTSQYMVMVAPHRMREVIFQQLHDNRLAGHLGVSRTNSNIRKRFWWPGMKSEVSRWCQECIPCQRRNNQKGITRSALRQGLIGMPMERVAFDILSFPDETDMGNKCVLVLCDYFTKWTEAIALPNHQAETVADAMVIEFFLRYGSPRVIHSDGAPEFRGKVIGEVFRLLQIHHTRTTAYRPQSDGLVERFNRTLIAMLSKLCEENKHEWDIHLPYVMAAYRASEHDTTHMSPNLLFLGRETTLPIDLMYPIFDKMSPKCPNKYAQWVACQMKDNFAFVRENTQKAARRQKRNYDARTRDHEYSVGDWVWRWYKPLTENKLNFPFMGPYLVVAKIGEVTYKIQGNSGARIISIHVDHMKPFFGTPPIPSWIIDETPMEEPVEIMENVAMDDSVREDQSTEIASQHVPDREDITQPLLENVHQGGLLPERKSTRKRTIPKHLQDYDLFTSWD